jgi:hypothetical protein
MGALWQGVRGFVLDHLCKDIPLDVLNVCKLHNVMLVILQLT